jgi:hypothetical protein
MKMRTTTMIAWALLAGAPAALPQVVDEAGLALSDEAVRLQQADFATRAKALNDNISVGWGQGAVRAIMGEPDRVQHSTDGHDQIEVWGYQGFDVRIEFRNGYAQRWFVRFGG